jgi:hypothetical protein
MKTKSSSTCPILGSLFPLHETQLPTSEDVLRHYYYLREFSVTPATIRKTALFTEVYKAVCAVYRKASFPTLSLTERRIIEKMKILNTPAGQIAKQLVEGGVQLGISSRGLGSTRQEGSTTMVEDDFQLLCFDLVSEPSTTGAYLVAESKIKTHLTKSDRINRALNDVLGEN